MYPYRFVNAKLTAKYAFALIFLRWSTHLGKKDSLPFVYIALFCHTPGYRRVISIPMVFWHLSAACKHCFVHNLIHCQHRNHSVRFSRRTNSSLTGALMDKTFAMTAYANGVRCSHYISLQASCLQGYTYHNTHIRHSFYHYSVETLDCQVHGNCIKSQNVP